MSRLATLLLINVLVLSSLVMAGCVFAESVTQPAVPEFTLEYVDNSYDVPTTYTIDPHTGENVTHQGYHVDKVTLLMIIQNQPLVYQYEGGIFGTVNFYYNVQVKGHYEEEWFQFFSNDELPIANASSTETSLTLGVLGEGGLSMFSRSEEVVPFGGEEDFQVQAMIGYFHKVAVPLSGWVFEGETSGWSNTQTLTIEEVPTPSPEPTSTPYEEPEQTEQDMTAGAILAVTSIVVFLSLLFYFIKRK